MEYQLDTRPRVYHTRKHLDSLNIDQISVLDLGSRDASALTGLQKSGRFGRLVATDIHHRIANGVEFIAHDLEQPLPFQDHSFDVVICSDVLEHVERKNQLASEIRRVAREHVIISLPNTQHHKYVRGLRRGNMGEKYVFDVEDGADRHRWITFYDDNINFVSKYFSIERRIDICSNRLDLIMARLKPTKFVKNQFMVCRLHS